MRDEFNKKWITDNSVSVCSRYPNGVLTLRALYYQLVALGMTNSMRHYKRVCAAMADARRDGIINYEQFSDQDRGLTRKTMWTETDYDEAVQEAKEAIERWMTIYVLNMWENQEYYPEVWIEKKALIGVFKPVCDRNKIALAACKGYPSLTFLNEAAARFRSAKWNADKKPIILYFGDHDPTGDDIPRSIEDNMYKDFGTSVEVRRISLTKEQVMEWGLPPAPTKTTDSRAANWDGLGQVELDAVEPGKMRDLIQESIDEIFDEEKYEELQEREEEEEENYKAELKDFIIDLADEEKGEEDDDED